MTKRPSNVNGSSRKKHVCMVILPYIKHDLSRKVFDKFKGVDYDEISSSVAMLKFVRILLTIVVFFIMKFGRKTAFLN
jgi:hypothetical protein